MKFDKLTIANALALTTLIFWVACSLFLALFPAFYMQTGNWWMHGRMMGSAVTMGSFGFGGITMIAVAWVTGFLFGWSYEQVSKWEKKK